MTFTKYINLNIVYLHFQYVELSYYEYSVFTETQLTSRVILIQNFARLAIAVLLVHLTVYQ